jgi:hypothetical protein
MSARPDHIGAFVLNGTSHFYGVTAAEMDRGAFAVTRVLRSFDFKPGSTLLVISLVPEIVHYGAFERAAQMLGFYGINADDSAFDAGRVESISRQFDPPAMVGVSGQTIEGLRMFGHNVENVFAGRTVWARADAYNAVKVIPRVNARRIVSLGPLLAFECAHGGIHYDSRDWIVEVRGGWLHLSSRLERVHPINDLDTGLRGVVEEHACSCGNRDATIRIED